MEPRLQGGKPPNMTFHTGMRRYSQFSKTNFSLTHMQATSHRIRISDTCCIHPASPRPTQTDRGHKPLENPQPHCNILFTSTTQQTSPTTKNTCCIMLRPALPAPGHSHPAQCGQQPSDPPLPTPGAPDHTYQPHPTPRRPASVVLRGGRKATVGARFPFAPGTWR